MRNRLAVVVLLAAMIPGCAVPGPALRGTQGSVALRPVPQLSRPDVYNPVAAKKAQADSAEVADLIKALVQGMRVPRF